MNIDIKSLLNKAEKINIIDIRSKEQYLKSHLNNSINIEYNQLINNPIKYIQKTKKYYIYCQSGNTSKKLCNYLNSIGFNTINVIGGYNSYLLR